MTTATLTLTEFLLARIAEDEAAARQAIDAERPGDHWQWVRQYDGVVVDDPAADTTDEWQYSLRTVEQFPTTSGVGDLPAFVLRGLYASESLGFAHIARHDPARVLAECEAKREVVERCGQILAVEDWEYTDAPTLADDILSAHAAVYADHDDYRSEWAI